MTAFRLRGAVKNYEWGKRGFKSIVSVLQRAAHKDFFVAEEIPYAELWLGTHESGPATIPELNDYKLLEWLTENPETLGENITQEFGSSTGLPFLFKVLSVNKALSIQAHPDKDTAAKLHKDFPQHYPDDNHKPELAIAINNFEALCGFRPSLEIKIFFEEIQELQELTGSETATDFINSGSESNLRSLFTAVMTSPPDLFQAQLLKIVENFKQNKYTSQLAASVKDIFFRTVEQYSGDIGCLCLFFLNYINLQKGEAIFLAANEPHAYLFGDCIECMACSDNVVRAGLTPKYRDVQTLCNMLTYNCKTGAENKFSASSDPNDPCVKTYDPPVKEFAIDSISLPSNAGIYSLKVIQSASILLIIQGNCICQFEKGEIELSCGTALFISSGHHIDINPSSDLLIFRAYCK